MTNRKKAQQVLWCQHLGFALIIALSWLDELFSLPSLVLGGDTKGDWRESTLETVIILVAWIVVSLLTRKLLTRLYYLEDFLRVCAWCKKIEHNDHWMPLEEYFARGFDTVTSHGICPGCATELKNKIP